MAIYYLFSPFLRRILPPNDITELPCCSCYQEEWHNSVLHILPKASSRLWTFCQSQKASSHGAGPTSLLWGHADFTCHISEHPNSILSIFITQLISESVAWDVLSYYAFRSPLSHFLFPHLSKHWRYILDLFTLSSMASNLFIFSASLSFWAVTWIISPALSSGSQSLFCMVC